MPRAEHALLRRQPRHPPLRRRRDDPFESNFFKYFTANFNKLGLKKLITTSYDGSPIAGQIALVPEHNGDDTGGNGKRPRPKAVGVIVDHVKDGNDDGATDIEDVKLFLERNQAAHVALKADDKYPGGDFRSTDYVELLKQADIVVTNPGTFARRGVFNQICVLGKWPKRDYSCLVATGQSESLMP